MKTSMSRSINNVTRYNTLDFGKIIFDDFVVTSRKQYVVSKMWYQQSSGNYAEQSFSKGNTKYAQPKSMYIQTSSLSIDDITKSDNIVLNLENEMTEFFDKLDELSLSYLKMCGATKTYGLKNIKYIQIIKEVSKYDEDDKHNENKNVLKLKIMNNTKFFMVNNNASQKYDDVKNLLKHGCNIKTILEIDGLVIDLEKNEIFINIMLRQVLIQKVKPLKIELTEYSFISSDSEELDNADEMDVNDLMLNTQTEYLDQHENKVDTTVNSETQSESDVPEESNMSEESNDSDESDVSVDVDKFLRTLSQK
jgi:hypothetical protein